MRRKCLLSKKIDASVNLSERLPLQAIGAAAAA